MAKQRMTPHAPVRHVNVGHFVEASDYRVERPGGSGDYLLIVTFSGRGLITHAGGSLALDKADAVLYSPGAAQDYATDAKRGRWELRWAHFQPRPHWTAWLNWPGPSEGLGHLRITDATALSNVRHALADAYRFHVGQLPGAEAFAMNALERALLWCDRVNPQSAGQPVDDRVQKAIDHLTDHLAAPHTVDELAAHVSLSPSRFSHLFREQVGITPMQLLERLRVERAKQMLEQTAQPIQTIAHRVGYDSPFYFSLRFKKATGQSPRAYRRSVV